MSSFAFPASTQSNFSFSTPAAVSSSFNFGASAPAAGGLTSAPLGTPFTGFGTPAASSTAVASSLPGFGNLTQPSTSLFPSFGQTSTTTTPSLGGFGLGLTATPATSLGAPTSKPLGLGGVEFSDFSKDKLNGSSTKNDAKVTIKETPLPDELTVLLDHFKKYVKEQKVIREEISRVSSKPLTKVHEEIEAVNQVVSDVATELHRNSIAIETLKRETAQELKHAEIAQRTKDTPPALQYENTGPIDYFQELVADFGQQMKSYQVQISHLEQLMLTSNPDPLTPDELNALLKRLYETFVTIAAKLHTLHEGAQKQKEIFLTYEPRHSNTFKLLETSNTSYNKSVPKLLHEVSMKKGVAMGPSPFISNPASKAMSSVHNQTQQNSNLTGLSSIIGVPPTQMMNPPFSATGYGSNTSLQMPFSSSPFKPLGK